MENKSIFHHDPDAKLMDQVREVFAIIIMPKKLKKFIVTVNQWDQSY